MSHRPTLLTSVAELRRAYTGETDSTLLPAARAALAALDPDQRSHVESIIYSDFGARLLGDPGPTVDPAIRSAVLLDTAVHRQQELETAILLALGRVHTYRGHGTGVSQRALCPIVRPTSDGLTLHLSPQTLGAVLAELLPRETDGHLVGVSGLRFRLLRRHVDLFLADSESDVRVSISSTTYREFAAALAFATTVNGVTQDPRDEPSPLSELEQMTITHDRIPGLLELASPLLRRFGLFQQPDWISLEPIGSTCLRIDWAGGSTPAHVAAMLTHPIAGLRDDRFRATTLPDRTIILGCEGIGGVISLRQHVTNPVPPNVTIAWTAFHKVISAPNPTMPVATHQQAEQPRMKLS